MTIEPEPRGHRRAVFLDRDGTVNEEVGYLDSVERLRVFPFSAAAVRQLNAAGFCIVLITNQAGVARGFLTEARLADIHTALTRELEAEGARLDAIYYCPHHPDGRAPFALDCDCRKP